MRWLLLCLVTFSTVQARFDWNPPGVDMLLASLPAPELNQVMACYELRLAAHRLEYFSEAQILAGELWTRWEWCRWLESARDSGDHPFHEQATWLTRNGDWDLISLGQTYLLLTLTEAENRVAKLALEVGDGNWASWFREVTLDDSHPFNEEWLSVLQARQQLAGELNFWELALEGCEEFEEALEEYGLLHHIDGFAFIDRWADPSSLDWQVRYPDARPLFEEVTAQIRQRIVVDPPARVPDPASVGSELMRQYYARELARDALKLMGGCAVRWEWEQWAAILWESVYNPDHPLQNQILHLLGGNDFVDPDAPEDWLYDAMEAAMELHLPDPYLPLYESWIEEGYQALSPKARHALGALIYSENSR